MYNGFVNFEHFSNPVKLFAQTWVFFGWLKSLNQFNVQRRQTNKLPLTVY